MAKKKGGKKGKKGPITLWAHPLSQPSRSIMMLLEAAGIKHTFNMVDIMKGAHKSPEYLAKNPMGQVPALQDGALNLREGAALLLHIARTRKTGFYPKSAALRTQIDIWLNWSHTGTRLLTLKLLVPKVFGRPSPPEAEVASAHKALKFLEEQLEASPTNFIAGTKGPSIADFFLIPEIDQCGAAAFGLCDLSPRIQQYLSDFGAAVPCYAKNFGTVCQIAKGVAKPKQKHTLMYFGIPALGEPCRLLLELGGFDWEDKRLTFKQWPELKKTTKWGQMPTLRTEDGKEMTQSTAIVRYLATQTKMEGSILYPFWDPKTCFEIDEVVCAFEDARMKLIPTFSIQDPEEKKAARAKLFAPDGGITGYLTKLDNLYPDDFMVAGRITLADVWCFYTLNFLRSGFWDGVDAKFLDSYANLKKRVDRVSKLDAVAAYYAKFAEEELYKVFQPGA